MQVDYWSSHNMNFIHTDEVLLISGFRINIVELKVQYFPLQIGIR